MPAWECYACTWLNDECNIDCLMCQTKRARNLSPNARKTEESTVCRQAADDSNDAVPEKSLRQQNNDVDKNRKEPIKEKVKPLVRNQEVSTQIQHSQPSNQQEEVSAVNENESNSKWDAFASLENNYESSDSGEDESDSDSDGSDVSENYYGDVKDEKEQCDVGKDGADQSQWNAFESLEATLGDDSSSSSSSGEESDCILIEDNDEKKMAPAATSIKSDHKTECVDLVDTDDEEDVRQQKDTKPKRINSRKRKRASDQSAITLMDGDSDSSYLSEVESSRPLQPSPATRQGRRSLPPWQRAARSKSKSPSILQNERVLPRESFSLFSNRNDVSGSGLNETRTTAPAARQPRQRKTSTKSSTTTKSGSRRRKRSNSDGAAPAKKKRRTRKYRRSSKRGGRGGRGGAAAASGSNRSNNAWSARERGIRQPIRENNGGSYMNITKQEPMLRNIGGASIQF